MHISTELVHIEEDKNSTNIFIVFVLEQFYQLAIKINLSLNKNSRTGSTE